MKKFYASGRVVVLCRAKSSGEIRRKFYDFSRNVYADDVDKAFEVLEEALRKKHVRNTAYYDVVDFAVLQFDIYRLENEGYDWAAHRRMGMSVEEA